MFGFKLKQEADLIPVARALQQIYLDSGWSHLANDTEQGKAIRKIHDVALMGLLALPPKIRAVGRIDK